MSGEENKADSAHPAANAEAGGRTPTSTVRAVLLSLLVLAWAFLLSGQETKGASEGSVRTRDALVMWHRHQEGLVRSMRCTYELARDPTPPENIPLIAEVIRLDKRREKPGSFILTEEEARKFRVVVRSWRKRRMEREEHLCAADPENPEQLPETVAAFDGHIVRSYGPDQNGVTRGTIGTAQTAFWYNPGRFHPYSLLYEYLGTAFSEILEKGLDFRATVVETDGRKQIKASVRGASHPCKGDVFEFLYDENNRLVELGVTGMISGVDREPHLYYRHRYLDYRVHRCLTGEAIWFPHTIVVHDYIGNLADGTPVEYRTHAATIRNIEFNVEIPDEMFVLQFPPGIQIWDGITGRGWVPHVEDFDTFLEDALQPKRPKRPATASGPGTARGPEERVVPASPVPLGKATPEPVEPAERGGAWVLPAIIGGAAVAAVVVALVLLRRRRGR